ncbi:prepilin peptidase [Bosea sp. SSUT16]|jgi:prepilin peptidase CpaA|uniref:Prepilin peptidase n=1 Tax=Bosea spartocytisi TaxID=2773451 RepID=A0A927I0G4_9HYPH|nr:prepilin peptidase [Bosea spartocytisi]MBD3845368.1 prepilin peptidase [Bosea spartocytisi]MCT4472538.1 prepilin peptidase [Bosea spartocytisi]
MSLPLIILLGVFPFLMAYAAASDLVSMTISNRLCLALIASFAVSAALLGLDLREIGWHLAAGGLVLVVAFGLFAAGWIGGGDAKLAAATALWFGFDQLMPYLTVAGLFGGVLTLLIVQLRARPLPAPAEHWSWARRLHAANQGVPYGIALAFAALFVLPETAIWRAAIGL